MDTPPPEPRRNLWLLPLLLTGVAGSLLAVFWFALIPNLGDQNGENPSALTSRKLSRVESLKLIGLRNLAIGSLENHDFLAADAALSEIHTYLPLDPFTTRNLAICRQLALENTDKQKSPDKFKEYIVRANEAVELSKLAEPKSFVPWVIASRVAIQLDQKEVALSALRQAMQLGKQSIGPAYDLFTFLKAAPGENQNDEGFNALKIAYEKEPENLFIIKDWLPLLAQRKAPEISDAIKSTQKTIAPFVEMIKVHTRVDLNETIKTAQTAVSEGKWPAVQHAMMILRNLILQESARDKRFVILDSLEYLIMDFNAESRSRLNLPEIVPEISSPVHFQKPDNLSNWPDSNGTTSIVTADFDLDGYPDIGSLQEDRFIVWRRATGEQSWSILMKQETGGTFRGILACDFDDDVDPKIATRIAGIRAENHRHKDSDSIETPRPEPCHTADPDLILFGSAGLKLFENSIDPKTEERTLIPKSGGKEFDEVRDVLTAVVLDIDADGDLDLVAQTSTGLKIFSNRGNLTFEDTTARSALPPAGVRVTAFALVDWDKDSDIDLIIATTDGGGLLENVRHGQMRYLSLKEFPMLKNAVSLSIADFDENFSWDLAIASPNGMEIVTTDLSPVGNATVRKRSSLVEAPIKMAQIGDFDNDGYVDVLVVSNDETNFFRCDERCSFTKRAASSQKWLPGVSLLSIDDLDRDGDLDVIVVETDRIVCHSSQCCEMDNPTHGWLELSLISEQVKSGAQNAERRTNHLNLGGLIEIRSGNHYQSRIITSEMTHFGVGSRGKADLARILWTNGIPTNEMDLSFHETRCIEQKLGGSCPYLYTWNGEKFVFVTDLLWNAPLGLKFAENVVAPWREWEYQKIDGKNLKAINHEYPLRITAELWEADYFDQFKLFAVDHPEGTEIFTNEKVGPASLAEPKIHTVKSPRLPVAARDTFGRDVLSQVTERDGNYTKTFDRRLAQGFTEEHFLELDLGEFPEAKNIMLYLTGWMYPGSTSLSVQLSQNPDLPKPKPPALYTPDEKGEWREVRPFMGFPGGKTKTIAVDVSDVFTNRDHRLRIVSTMQIYWDAAFYTVDDAPVPIRQEELTLAQAELVDRGGVSFRSWPVSGNGPDQFDYKTVVKGEQWPAMSGHFTKLGDVLPLLTARDDHLVVTGSGDEIQLGFSEPTEPPPTGWVRDFILYSVGWDKDADPNTVYGDTVEPLPFEAMTVYGHREGEPRPMDSKYEKYLSQFQTRTRNPIKFRKGIFQTQRN